MRSPADSPPPSRLHRTWVEIDLPALRRNFRRVADAFGPGVGLIPSVKKQAYGHGLIEVVEALRGEPGFAMAGVATVEEGLELRERFPELPILAFTVLAGEALIAAVAAGLTLTITNLAEGQAAAQAAREADPSCGLAARAHFKLDTGMGRLGRLADDVAGDLVALRALPGLRVEALYTHLADAWDNRPGGQAQLERLLAFRRAEGQESLSVHVGGSDALALVGRLPPGALARPGIALYGDHAGVGGLEPAMTFKTRVVFRRRVPAGTPIGYGGDHITERPTELAVIGAGYGNGYPRSLSGRGARALIGGARCPLLGRVSMDQCVVDVDGVPDTDVGDEVVLFGRQDGAMLPVAEVAGWAGTIGYELMCLAGGLNPRRTVRNEPA